jgi:hypothetical protein
MYCLTKLNNVLLLFYYWLLVSASMVTFRPIFTKSLKNAGVHSKETILFMGSQVDSLILTYSMVKSPS